MVWTYSARVSSQDDLLCHESTRTADFSEKLLVHTLEMVEMFGVSWVESPDSCREAS